MTKEICSISVSILWDAGRKAHNIGLHHLGYQRVGTRLGRLLALPRDSTLQVVFQILSLLECMKRPRSLASQVEYSCKHG